MLHMFAAVLALSGPTEPVVEARIAEVIANPERYRDRTLSLRGQIDACYGWACNICPEDMTPDAADPEKCLRLSFDGFGGVDDEADFDGSFFSRDVAREMEEAFRFTIVTAEGAFDPSCLPPKPPPAGERDGREIEELIICTDRASTWRGVQVRAVHRRLPSNAGLVLSQPRDEPLVRASATIARGAEAAYREYVLTFDTRPDWTPIAVFQTETPALDDPAREAWACVCRVDDCPDAWPRRAISLWAATINDPYVCYFALERQGVWRIYPE